MDMLHGLGMVTVSGEMQQVVVQEGCSCGLTGNRHCLAWLSVQSEAAHRRRMQKDLFTAGREGRGTRMMGHASRLSCEHH